MNKMKKNLNLFISTKRLFSITSIKFQEINRLQSNLYNGCVQIAVPLVTKQDKCLFTLKPINDTVGNFMDYIKNEDKAIEKVQIFNLDGLRISSNTPIGQLVSKSFNLKINETNYLIEPSKQQQQQQENSSNSEHELIELKNLISKLYLNLNIDEFEMKKRDDLLKKLELYKNELEPLEKQKEILAIKAKKHTNRMIWLGLGMMSMQAGILARLTWFDYSWDIVEPISYFVTYTAVIGVYAYFVLTRKVNLITNLFSLNLTFSYFVL
jgi:calcium uniporter protein, mitochondrial